MLMFLACIVSFVVSFVAGFSAVCIRHALLRRQQERRDCEQLRQRVERIAEEWDTWGPHQ